MVVDKIDIIPLIRHVKKIQSFTLEILRVLFSNCQIPLYTSLTLVSDTWFEDTPLFNYINGPLKDTDSNCLTT